MKLSGFLFVIFSLYIAGGADGQECPTIDSDDMVLLPQCSLKTTLKKIDQCIFQNMPFRLPGVSFDQCSERFISTFNCLTGVLATCMQFNINATTCPSLLGGLSLPGGATVHQYLEAVRPYLPMAAQYACVDLSLLRYTSLSTILPPSVIANITLQPTCGDDVLPSLVKMAEQLMKIDFSNMTAICMASTTVNQQLFHLLMNSCDLSQITSLLSSLNVTLPIDKAVLDRAINITIEYSLNEMEIPQCKECSAENQARCGAGGRCMMDGFMNEHCVCSRGYMGENCTESNCDVPFDDDDLDFLPSCSLKTTLAFASECINKNFPFIVGVDVGRCYGNVHSAVECLGKVFDQCNASICSDPKFDVMMNFRKMAYGEISNFSSPFMTVALEFLCGVPTDGMFRMPNLTFGIGEPVCANNTIDKLLSFWVDTGNLYLLNPLGGCMNLELLKWKIFNYTRKNCDWDNIMHVLPPTMRANASYYSSLLMKTHSFFTHWVYPPCKACERTVCQNGGTCSTLYGLEFCTCAQGYYGDRCQYSWNQGCFSGYCHNGGSCMIQFGFRRCLCREDYSGQQCETYIGGGGNDMNCREVGEHSSQCEMAEAWMCRHIGFKKAIFSWQEQFKSWWESCPEYQAQWSEFYSEWKSATQCSDTSRIRCASSYKECFHLGNCQVCYCPDGRYSNWNSLLPMWMKEQEKYENLLRVYKSISGRCSRSSGCGTTEPVGEQTTGWVPHFTTPYFQPSPTAGPGSEKPHTPWTKSPHDGFEKTSMPKRNDG